MAVIGLDIGTHSIKMAKRSENGPVEFTELPTKVLYDPDGKKVVSVGEEATLNYLDRHGNIPFGVELLEGQIVREKCLESILAVIGDSTIEHVGVAITGKDISVKPIISAINTVFQDAKVVDLDEVICAAAVYKYKNPDSDTDQLVVCDLGYSALKLALCSFKNKAIQIKKTIREEDLGWQVFQTRLLETFPEYLSVKNEPVLEPARISFRDEFLQQLEKGDYDNGLKMVRVMEEGGDIIGAGGIHDTNFFTLGDARKVLKVGVVHEQYHNFITEVLDSIDKFLSENRATTTPIFVTGAGASPDEFKDLFITSIQKHSGNISKENVIISDNPKHTISEGAFRIAAEEIRVFEAIDKAITYKGPRLVNGNIENEYEITPPSKYLTSGDPFSLCRIVVIEPVESLMLSYGDKEFSLTREIECGNYDLAISMNRFGKLDFELRNDTDQATIMRFERVNGHDR
ncbi:MAG: hypothetical protein PHW11_10220 [Anaerolineaceae bacterium]|nr:hypothetical protein [Anaerolineaceae bacterium]